jgi:restriction system protein
MSVVFGEDLPGPQFVQFFGPVLHALRELGGSARPGEVRDKILELYDVPEALQVEVTSSGQPRYDNRVAWARFYLVRAGMLDSSVRGVWALTDAGQKARLDHAAALALFNEVHSGFTSGRVPDPPDNREVEVEPPDTGGAGTATLRTQVLELLGKLPPSGFERFCQRLLRESGFQSVTVTGKSGDGGIDGIGLLEVNPLVTFKVLFQCKRYTNNSVSPSQVRDFRGAMQGRADKGIIITTGTFTAEARKEAVRDGVPPIELVDGEKLVEMMEELGLGLVPVQAFKVDEGFFEQYLQSV